MKVKNEIVLYWTEQNICLHNTQGKLLRSYTEIPSDGLPSEMAIMPKFQYLVIGLKSGYLTVCKYLTNLSNLFTIKAHLKQIDSLELHPTCENMIMSAASDGYIKIWNVEKQAEVFSLNLESIISEINFMGNGIFSFVKRKKLYVFFTGFEYEK